MVRKDQVDMEIHVSIVSIQADQSRRQRGVIQMTDEEWGFNRINSGRSIPTAERFVKDSSIIIEFQSYQFRQINPDTFKTFSSFSK